MIFDTWAYYLGFLLPSALLFRRVGVRFRPWVLAGFGTAFFLYFSLQQLGGAAGAACLLIFLWESLFSRWYRPGSILCWVGVGQSLLVLVVFKYWNFLTGLALGGAIPAENPLYWQGAFLPLGVSFFTFEFIHYAVDRHRGATPAGTFGEYLAFILFFPTMVAGPIKRYQDFHPKLAATTAFSSTDWMRGVTRILAGLTKKLALADVVSAFSDNLHRETIAAASRWALPLWLLAYGAKIYLDFSAYSDIAIGSARLFGLRVPENFDWPYAQTNIAEFWSHWHISLSSWLRDYVFIPLGGSRVSVGRVYVNVLATMLVSGLWHGAGLNFVVWGLWHGAMLCGHRLWTGWHGARTTGVAPGPAGAFAAWLLTFCLVQAGWSFFCMDLSTALFFWRRLLVG